MADPTWQTSNQKPASGGWTITGNAACYSGSDSGSWTGKINTDSGYASYDFVWSRCSGSTNDFVCGITNNASGNDNSPNDYYDFYAYYNDDGSGSGTTYLYQNSSQLSNFTQDITDAMKLQWDSATTVGIYRNDVLKYTWTVGAGVNQSNSLMAFMNEAVGAQCTLGSSATSTATRLPPPPLIARF